MITLRKIIQKTIELFILTIFGKERLAKFLGVTIGKKCRIYIREWGSEPFLIHIGNNVTVTSGVTFLTHDGSTCLVFNESGFRYQKYGSIYVGNNVFIGVNTIIMPGVIIGDNVVIGAGSIVTNNIPDNVVAIGTPAKVVSSFLSYCHKIQKTCADDEMLSVHEIYKDKVYAAIEVQNSKANKIDG
ncbi:acyltransferase [Vibrio diabolicus]